MKPPWLRHSRDEAELEALQTDVMRFMAIIALCLAAIFSLVQSAAQEQSVPKQSITEKVTLERAAEMPAPIDPVPVENIALATEASEAETESATEDRELPPLPAQSLPQIGFSLEFASVKALETLLQARQVQLYARHGDQFWSVDTLGTAAPVAAPPSFYQMHAETVPRRFRNALPDIESFTGATWGVTLPTQAMAQIHRLTTGREGGNLLITGGGEVVLE